ncbi:MAG: response regulator [Terriglobales bacterium]
MARKILLADDSVTAQNMGRKILADAGYDVVTVNNGSAALKRITELKPDLIVLDVYMPGYSGLEVCQRLKDAAGTAHIPVLLTVGKLEPFKPEEARRVKADAHIVKPFEASELLTAITRLEDRMVPQQSEGSRFSTSVSGVERFGGEGSGRKTESNEDADTGWKSRLRFPSKKKKEEPEPEPENVAAEASFRDFRKGKGKTGASAPFTVKAPPPPGQEPGLVPDIPRDITPDELDALSALAAKLDGPIPAAENVAGLAEKMGPAIVPAAEFAAAKTEVEVPTAAAEANKEAKKEVEPPAPVVEPAAAAVEAPASAAEGKSEGEIPVGHLEPASEGAAVVVAPAAAEVQQHETERPETQHPETPDAGVADAVNTALLAQEPAPVGRNDEPMFVSAASAVEQAAEEKIEGKPSEAVAKSDATEASTLAEAVAAKDLESTPEELKAEESKPQQLNAEELKVEKIEQPVPVAVSLPEPAEAEEPAPSDAELAEALRLLTPATGHADVSTVPSHGTLVAAGQLLAEEAVRNAATGPRWVAEPVGLSPEEAAISLEAEMFRTFAATFAAPSGGEIESVETTGVSAIAAAVENRLAEAELAASAKALSEQEAERCSSEHASETTAAETSVVEAPAEVVAAASNAASPVVDGIEPEKIEPEKLEVEQKDSQAKVTEEAPAEEVAAATFADAVGRDEVEIPAEQNGEPVGGTTAAVAEENQDSSSDSGGRESMGKDVKAKSGKSNWHQIHTAPTNAAANSDVVEAAKQAEHGAEEAPKAMAAAASAEGETASASVPDASTIASIVDSVMADLRPRIVEEIARKLAGK